MSGKLDQSLDAIMKESKGTRRASGRRPGARRAAVNAKAKIAAPSGGISKNTKQARPTKGSAPVVSAPLSGDSKIIVSGLVSHMRSSTRDSADSRTARRRR